MTLLLSGLALCLSIALMGFVRDLGATSGLEARAQLAADAAALAAVAESGPYGASHQRSEARRYARANGGELLECACEPVSTAVQVSVGVDGVIAEARAVLDPAALAPASLAFDGTGLHPALAAALRRLVDASKGRVHLVSGYRSPPEQAALWEEAVARYGSPEAADDWVARAGHSMHERGLAVDLGGDLGLAVRLVGELRLPLHRPLDNEPWHFELVGWRR